MSTQENDYVNPLVLRNLASIHSKVNRECFQYSHIVANL